MPTTINPFCPPLVDFYSSVSNDDLSYIVILIKLETTARVSSLAVVTLLIATSIVCRILRLSLGHPRVISRFFALISQD